MTKPHRVFIPQFDTAPDVPSQDTQLCAWQGETMGTTWQVQCYLPQQHQSLALQNGIQACLNEVVNEMSHWEIQSHLSRFNHAPADTWHQLPPAFFTVLDYALFIAEQTQGAYDPTIGHLSNIWGFGPAGKIVKPPSESAILSTLEKTNWQKLIINQQAQTAWQAGGIHLDFSSIAKGYAVDQVAQYLQTQNISSYLVEVGGELRGVGIKPDGQPWWVEIESLSQFDDNALKNLVALHHLSIATSGDYRRQFTLGDQEYSHTIDPRTGKPITHGLASVAVMHPQCMMADALATAMTVLGLEEGLHYADRLHIAALFTQKTKQGFQQHMSRALQAMLDED